MTTTQTPSAINLLQELLDALEAGATASPQPAVDPKFEVTSEFVDVPQSVADALLASYHIADDELEQAKKKLEAAKQAIIQLMGKGEVLRVAETEQEIVTHRVVSSMVVDTAKLRQEQPEIAAKYQKPRISRPFKVLH